MSVLFCLLMGLIVGIWIGWRAAHEVVAVECERLGGFYVGQRVFRCTEAVSHE